MADILGPEPDMSAKKKTTKAKIAHAKHRSAKGGPKAKGGRSMVGRVLKAIALGLLLAALAFGAVTGVAIYALEMSFASVLFIALSVSGLFFVVGASVGFLLSGESGHKPPAAVKKAKLPKENESDADKPKKQVHFMAKDKQRAFRPDDSTEGSVLAESSVPSLRVSSKPDADDAGSGSGSGSDSDDSEPKSTLIKKENSAREKTISFIQPKNVAYLDVPPMEPFVDVWSDGGKASGIDFSPGFTSSSMMDVKASDVSFQDSNNDFDIKFTPIPMEAPAQVVNQEYRPTSAVLKAVKDDQDFSGNAEQRRALVIANTTEEELSSLLLDKTLFTQLAAIGMKNIKKESLPLIIALALVQQAASNCELFSNNMAKLHTALGHGIFSVQLPVEFVCALLQMGCEEDEVDNQGITLLLSVLLASAEVEDSDIEAITDGIKRLIRIEQAAKLKYAPSKVDIVLRSYVKTIISEALQNGLPANVIIINAILADWPNALNVEADTLGNEGNTILMDMAYNHQHALIEKLLAALSDTQKAAVLNYTTQHHGEEGRTPLGSIVSQLKPGVDNEQWLETAFLLSKHGATNFGSLEKDDSRRVLFEERLKNQDSGISTKNIKKQTIHRHRAL